jgi:hypothetical protein
MARKTWGPVNFEVDPDAGETYRTTFNLDGQEYEMIVTPATPLRQLRGNRKVGLGGTPDGLLGEPPGPTISLGPRGGCACCGR